ncbi:MAG: hypothetical protein IJ871_02730, partial [Ruminococcus sp.]|nr:hypothetical protein [Ruminococcus sp.]
MPRYIDADELRDSFDNYEFTEYSDYSNVIDMIDDAPTVDAEPVKHGRWIMVRKTMLIPTGYMAVVEGHVLTKT